MTASNTARRIRKEPGRKPRLCISTCLLGEKVRYDGAGKLDADLLEAFGDSVEWVPVCPEVECGMAVPREPMHLADDPANPRMVTTATGEDQTNRMRAWIGSRLNELAREDLCGFILKSRSPSCGTRAVPVLDETGDQTGEGVGLFAAAVAERFPDLPVADERSLRDPDALSEFAEKLRSDSTHGERGDMSGLVVRELTSGDEALWFELDDETAMDSETPECDRRAGFLKRFTEKSAKDPRTFLIALDGSRPVGRLEGVFLDGETYFVSELLCSEGLPVSVVEDALAGHLADSFSRDGVGMFSSDRPRNAEINSALERAGFKIEKMKAYVARNLTGELPEPGVAFTYRTLAEAGRDQFIRLLTDASEGDPFEDPESRDPEAEFDELVEMAAGKYDPKSWFAALVDGEVVGAVLPQEFADVKAEGTLFYVAVLPRFRGRGYGRALHAAGLSMLKKRGVTKYIGSTDTRNAPMLRVFEANGCPQTSTQLFYRPPATRRR